MVAFHNVENTIQEVKQYVWILSDQVLVSTLPYLAEALERGAEFRLVLPQSIQPPKDIRERAQNPVFERAVRAKRMESRFLDKVDNLLCMSEKEVAALCFPNLEGRLDYRGFRAKDEQAHKWAEALFLCSWNRAAKNIPNQANRRLD